MPSLPKSSAIPREEVRGLMMQEITPDEDGALCLSSFQKLWTGASDALSLEIRLIRKDGVLTLAKLTVSLLAGSRGMAFSPAGAC